MNTRIQELDSLRGVAALLVVLYHFTTRYDLLYGHINYNYPSFYIGKFGVQLFFLLSGFVIYKSISNATSTKAFYINRVKRLFPTYMICVLITSTIINIYGLPGREVNLIETLINFTMLQGFIPSINHVDGVYWTLIIELKFYILMGLIIYFRLIDKIEFICLLWLIIGFIIKILNLFSSLYFINSLLILDYCNLFIIGIMLYKIYEKKDYKSLIMNSSIIVMSLFYELHNNNLQNMFIVFVCMLIFILIISKKLIFLCNKPLLFLGKISYTLYLVHQNIGYVIIRKMESRE